MEIHSFFSVPLLEFKHPDADRLCPSLREFFLGLDQEQYRDDIVRDTQMGDLFESRFDLFYWKQPEVQPLIRFCHTSLAQTVARLNGYDAAYMQKLKFDYHAWYHVTRSGGFQGCHNHPNASWSGIFCIDPGEPKQSKREGMVRFYDPRQNANYYMDEGNRNLQPPFALGGFEIQHEPGKLWLFPSYLLHEVFPYFGERPRLIVAFNAWIKADR